MIVQFKLMGFSLAEMNELTTQDYMDIIQLYTKQTNPPQGNQKRKATQADINKFTGYRPR